MSREGFGGMSEGILGFGVKVRVGSGGTNFQLIHWCLISEPLAKRPKSRRENG